jgi:hypothetical protein
MSAIRPGLALVFPDALRAQSEPVLIWQRGISMTSAQVTPVHKSVRGFHKIMAIDLHEILHRNLVLADSMPNLVTHLRQLIRTSSWSCTLVPYVELALAKIRLFYENIVEALTILLHNLESGSFVAY